LLQRDTTLLQTPRGTIVVRFVAGHGGFEEIEQVKSL